MLGFSNTYSTNHDRCLPVTVTLWEASEGLAHPKHLLWAFLMHRWLCFESSDMTTFAATSWTKTGWWVHKWLFVAWPAYQDVVWRDSLAQQGHSLRNRKKLINEISFQGDSGVKRYTWSLNDSYDSYGEFEREGRSRKKSKAGMGWITKQSKVGSDAAVIELLLAATLHPELRCI